MGDSVGGLTFHERHTVAAKVNSNFSKVSK